MKRPITLTVCAVLGAGMIVSTRLLEAKPEYSKKEKTSCVTCHVKAGKKDLNEKGDYYKKNNSLPPAK